MPPRGNEGYDFTPILTHYLFLFTSILAIAGWFTAFIGQAVATSKLGNGTVGTLWFAIFLQLFLILGVLHTLASDSISMHRFQISIFGAVAIVFAVQGVNQGIFSGLSSLDAMAAGWLILAIVDILWVLYFTSEEDSLIFHIFNMLGTGGLTPPNRRRRTRGPSMHLGGGGGSANGYPSGGYASGGGLSGDMPYDTKGPLANRSQGSLGGSVGQARSIGGGVGVGGGPGIGDVGPSSPLMGSGNAGVGAGGGVGLNSPERTSQPTDQGGQFTLKAKALYAYTASADDPNELSFVKGEILDIIDKQGKWWQAKRDDGSIGIAPSNYLQLL